MQEASEQTGKLADSCRRFTDEEPRYCVHFRQSFLARKNPHLPFRLSLLPRELPKRILNKQFGNPSQTVQVLATTNPGIHCATPGGSPKPRSALSSNRGENAADQALSRTSFEQFSHEICPHTVLLVPARCVCKHWCVHPCPCEVCSQDNIAVDSYKAKEPHCTFPRI